MLRLAGGRAAAAPMAHPTGSVLTAPRLSPEGRAAMMKSLQICAFFGLVSVAISMVYKVLLSRFNFQARFLLLGAQQAICLLFCVLMQRTGTLGVVAPPTAAVRPFILPGVLFVVNIMVGWLGLQLVSIPLFLCIRRTTVAFALVAEVLVLRKAQSGHTLLSVGLIVLGAMVAGYSTFSSDWRGITFTLGNNVLTAAQLATTKSAADATGARGFGIVYLNAMVALPLCLAGATLTGEWEYAAGHPALHKLAFWLAAGLASSAGVLMTYATILCSTQVSPLATTVTGNVKDVLATVVGALAFGDFDGSLSGVGGILLSFAGAGWFSAAKLAEAQGKQQQLDVLPTTVASAAAAGGEGNGGLGGADVKLPYLKAGGVSLASDAGVTTGASSTPGTAAPADDGSSGNDSGPDTAFPTPGAAVRPQARRTKVGAGAGEAPLSFHDSGGGGGGADVEAGGYDVAAAGSPASFAVGGDADAPVEYDPRGDGDDDHASELEREALLGQQQQQPFEAGGGGLRRGMVASLVERVASLPRIASFLK